MISVISSTNRKGSQTLKVAAIYKAFLDELGVDNQLLSLESLPGDFASQKLYEKTEDAFGLAAKYVTAADKFVFIIPEYNGSYPGVLKVFLDGIHPRYFRDKKAGIIGVSDGHAGNLRGQDHLTGVLNYMKVHVHYSKPKLSLIDGLIMENGAIEDERALRLLKEHAQAMIAF